jgi:transcriptional regulator with XRE-family HTH domain
MTTLSALILARRAELGMQQKQLAAAAGMHITTIWDYEHGKIRSPQLPSLFRLAKALQMPPAMLAAAVSSPEGTA